LLLVVPALGLIALAALAPGWRLFFLGGALGWLLAAELIWRGGAGVKYQQAVRHLRAGELEQALAVMDELIRAGPEDADRYRFRAELHRLAGQVELARRDYERLVHLVPDSLDGYIGLAEVWAQLGEWRRAQDYARGAAERDPSGWRAAYTQALIADRLGDGPGAASCAQAALGAGIPDRRLRLLVHLWLARGHARLGQCDEARAAVSQLRADSRGFAAWEALLAGEQAGPIRALLGEDVRLARALRDGTAPVSVLAEPGGDGC
jgi:tetratricopeptide (TPR) repeat protein